QLIFRSAYCSNELPGSHFVLSYLNASADCLLTQIDTEEGTWSAAIIFMFSDQSLEYGLNGLQKSSSHYHHHSSPYLKRNGRRI
ncbi:hypothetical protein L9F63_001745, partial [Diploptera punctata]